MNIPSTFTFFPMAEWYKNNKDIVDEIEECTQCDGSGCECGDKHECGACDGTGKSESVTNVYINRLKKDIDIYLHYLAFFITSQEHLGQIQQALETKKGEMIRAAYNWKPPKGSKSEMP